MLSVEVQCSSGTYVRTLAADLGRLLGGGAHLRNLRRTAVGSFTVAGVAAAGRVRADPAAAAMRDYATVQVDAQTAAIIATGRVLPAPPGEGPWAITDPDRRADRHLRTLRRLVQTSRRPRLTPPIQSAATALIDAEFTSAPTRVT